MSRIPVVIGNWKLHLNIAEGLALVTRLKNQLGAVKGVDVAVAPVFTALFAVARRLEDSRIGVCAQNCYWENSGAYTGEVAPSMLRDIGCQYCILGHSERRHLFGEENSDVGRKVHAAIHAGLTAVLCVGETESQRKSAQTYEVVSDQLEAAIASLSEDRLDRLIIAYEPVWAIGSGRTATPRQAQEVHEALRGKLSERFPTRGKEVRIQYGGSVKPGNAQELLAQPDIDGALVGGASLVAEDFVAIVKAVRPL